MNSQNWLNWLIVGTAGLAAGCSDPVPLTPPPTSIPAMGGATPFLVPGLRDPILQAAADADVPDDASVIGVIVNGQPRAWLVSAMSAMSRHVVNTTIGDIPVSITYCDRTNCTRILRSGNDQSGPLELGTGGWNGKELLLTLNGRMYAHSDRSLPLQDLPFERVTWKAWKEEHPETLIYTGLKPESRLSEQPAAAVNPALKP